MKAAAIKDKDHVCSHFRQPDLSAPPLVQPFSPEHGVVHHGLRPVLAGLDFLYPVQRRLQRHRQPCIPLRHPAAGHGRRFAQRHSRQPDDHRVRLIGRHAGGRALRHLSGRIRAKKLAGRRHPFYERYSALGAFHCDRFVYLRIGGGAAGAFFRLGGFAGIIFIGDSGGGAHHRKHAETGAQQLA